MTSAVVYCTSPGVPAVHVLYSEPSKEIPLLVPVHSTVSGISPKPLHSVVPAPVTEHWIYLISPSAAFSK